MIDTASPLARLAQRVMIGLSTLVLFGAVTFPVAAQQPGDSESTIENADLASTQNSANAAPGGAPPTCLISGVEVTTAVAVTQAECDGLVALYLGANGTNWIDRSGWVTIGTVAPSDPCGWHGVTCESYGIAMVNLRYNGLSGVIRSAVQGLANAYWIDLFGNDCLLAEDPGTEQFLDDLGQSNALCHPCTSEQVTPNTPIGPLDTNADWLATVNWYRASSGLGSVTANSTWSGGIAAHINYLNNTPSQYLVGEFANAHHENPASPYYTPDGDTAGRSSNLGWGSSDQDALDGWMKAPFHAIGMLRSGLTQVAFYRDPGSTRAGLDVIRGIENGGRCSDPILFPGPESTIHVRSFTGELPDPLETCGYSTPAGLPLIAMLPASPDPATTAALRDVWGNDVPSCLVSEHTYVTSDPIYGPTGLAILRGDNAVFIVPKDPLNAPRYRATISQPGKPDLFWSFNVSGVGASPLCMGEVPTVYIGLGDTPTTASDIILGTPGDDEIYSLAGNDIVCGLAGADTIYGDLGDDIINGGDGDDRIFGGKGADTIGGDGGNDIIHGNRGADWLYGGPGDDRIFGYSQADRIWGGPGDDRLHGNTGDDIIDGGDGNDRIFGYADNDELRGGPGFDVISGNFGDDHIDGGDGNDVLYGADGDDTVIGGPGNDNINGNSLNDVLWGGTGDDHMDGGIDEDVCHGEAGIDTATRCESTTGVP